MSPHLHRILTMALCVGACAPAWANPVQFRACSLVLAPQTMPDSQGRAEGLASEILIAVAKRLGWSITVDYMPWQRVVEESKAGLCDVTYTVLRRSDYEQFLAFPREPVLMQSNVLLVRKGSRVRYQGDLEQFMRAHSVGLYHDKAVNERFESLRRAPWARVDLAADSRQNLNKLLHNRFDAAIENDLTAMHELRSLRAADQVEVLQPPLSVVPAYAAFPLKGRLANQAHRFDQSMVDLRKTDQFRALVDKYLGEK